MTFIFLILFSSLVFAGPCGPHEIYVREQWINAYTKSDGIKVSAHSRNAHCRELTRFNYFQDSTKQTFKGIKTTLKKWTAEERKIIEDHLGKVPSWLKKYKLTEILRGDGGGNALNPAAAIPLTKTLLIFDQFFKTPHQLDILVHELSHIALHNIDPQIAIKFATASGWILERNKKPVPPQKVIMPDSGNSIGEDFANQIEIYHSNPEKLLQFNPHTFHIIKELIKREEAQK
jgi:hypothetical protein